MATERKRPTHTVVVPPDHIRAVVRALIGAECTFTAEPSLSTPGVWHVGVLHDGVQVINKHFGPTRDIGKLGDYL